MKGKNKYFALAICVAISVAFGGSSLFVSAKESGYSADAAEETNKLVGGGYAASGQLEDVGYTCQLYDATNGLPTSEANYLLCDEKGYIWIAANAGIFLYNGNTFERIVTTSDLSNGRALFEDSLHRIWVGTNDYGVMVIDETHSVAATYREELPSTSIRNFAEDEYGNIYIGTTAGVAVVNEDMNCTVLTNPVVKDQRILGVYSDAKGVVYGFTKNGCAFSIDDGKITKEMNGVEEGIGKITAIFPDQKNPGRVYLGTEKGQVYYGEFQSDIQSFEEIPISDLDYIKWFSYACDRLWITSLHEVGYLDTGNNFHKVEHLPITGGIEMMTSDYQGNLWIASSKQGVMKVVLSNFLNITSMSGLEEEIVYATKWYNYSLYMGTDNGLKVLGKDYKLIENDICKYIGDATVRCLDSDKLNRLWISTFDSDLGLVCQNADGSIENYTIEDGMPSNEVRCTYVAEDGTVYAATNFGLGVIKDGTVVDVIGEEEGIQNLVFLDTENDEDGNLFIGTDGAGLYRVKGDEVYHYTMEDGLESDVVTRVKYDEENDVCWIITSNAIQYVQKGEIHTVTTFPYGNNFDLFNDENGNTWVLSSCGLFCARTDEMLNDSVFEYRLYAITNGLTSLPILHTQSDLDKDGNLYIAGTKGVTKVNLNKFYSAYDDIKIEVTAVFEDYIDTPPSSNGTYVISKDVKRIQIYPAVLDYTLNNPLVHVYLEGSGDDGDVDYRSELKDLEFTSLSYGDYTLHIEVLDIQTGNLLQAQTFNFTKEPRIFELPWVNLLLMGLLAALVGFIVWWIMRQTIIRRQYVEIAQAKDEAERANSAKSRFLANISHEIRTPINTIMGMNEMILREDAEGVPRPYFMSVVNYALDIKTASQSLLGLINEILDISKIESGKMHLVESDYDTVLELRAICTMIRERSAQKDLNFNVDIDPTLPKVFYGDGGKIKQIILNLLTNAVKYTEKGGLTLKITVEEKKDEWCVYQISVKDTGIGVKDEDVDKLFTAYERLDEERNSAIQGTGLGLDISRRFAELLEGKLWCESVYGEGSEFFFRVRQKISNPEEIGEFKEKDALAKGPYVPQFIAPNARILVVDDNNMNLNVIRGLLKPTKIQITTATSGKEGVKLVQENDYHMIFLDHMMPEMDGLETLEKIREFNRDTPIYALTANAMSDAEEFYKSKGFSGFLAKPIDTDKLEQAIMAHLDDEIIEKPRETEESQELEEIPEEKRFLYDIEELNVEDGINASGGVNMYMGSLQLFYDTVEENSEVLENAFEKKDWQLYTIKAHALKTSARIVGANDLSALCLSLEEAGKKNDIAFIEENGPKAILDYKKLWEKLSPLGKKEEDHTEKPPLEEGELEEIYEALTEAVDQMDYDMVELLLKRVEEYSLPKEDTEKMEKLQKALHQFDWDAMEEILAQKK